jgi:uncharacterized membrane protein
MPIKLSDKFKNANWQLIIAAPVAAGILHICATFAAPYLTGASAYSRLAPALPLNKMEVLRPIKPGKEPIPFLSPDARYAMCKFDTSHGPVNVAAMLPPDAGWTLTVHSQQGDNLYAAVSTPGRITPVSLVLVASDDRFLGVTPEARGIARGKQPPVPVSATRGIVVVRGPDNGFAYQGRVLAGLKEARCSGRTF